MPAGTIHAVAELYALCSELPAAGKAPDWVELIPRGPRLTGRDGRQFQLDDPQTVVNAFRRRLPFDCCHSTHFPGVAAPAVGWIEQLEVREGAVWGRVAWTPRGRSHLENHEYRFVSPVLHIDPTGDDVPTVTALASAALTNNPNLDLAALNHAQAEAATSAPPGARNRGASTMNAELLKRLGLGPDATEAQIIEAVDALLSSRAAAEATATTAATQLETTSAELNSVREALNSARAEVPTLTTHVPRADFDALRAELNTFIERDRARERAAFELALNSLLDEACSTKKMAPASRSHHERMIRAMCSADGVDAGLKAAREFFHASPVVVPEQSLDGAHALNQALDELTPDEREAQRITGVSARAMLEAKRRLAASTIDG